MADCHNVQSQVSSKKSISPWIILPYVLLFVSVLIWVPEKIREKSSPQFDMVHMGSKGHKIGNVQWDFEPMGFLENNMYVKIHMHGNSLDISKFDLGQIKLEWQGKLYPPVFEPTVNSKHYSSHLIFHTGSIPKNFSILLPINSQEPMRFDFGTSTLPTKN